MWSSVWLIDAFIHTERSGWRIFLAWENHCWAITIIQREIVHHLSWQQTKSTQPKAHHSNVQLNPLIDRNRSSMGDLISTVATRCQLIASSLLVHHRSVGDLKKEKRFKIFFVYCSADWIQPEAAKKSGIIIKAFRRFFPHINISSLSPYQLPPSFHTECDEIKGENMEKSYDSFGSLSLSTS